MILYVFSSVTFVTVVTIPLTAFTRSDLLRTSPGFRVHFRTEVDGVGEQAFFVGLHIENTRVARVDTASQTR